MQLMIGKVLPIKLICAGICSRLATGKSYLQFFYQVEARCQHISKHFDGVIQGLNTNSAVLLLCVCVCVCVRVESRSSSPLLQYCSSRLVLSYRLPHEATRSDILPPLPASFPASPSPPSAPFCPPFTPLSVCSSRRHPFRSPPHSQTHKQTHLHLPRLPFYSPAPASPSASGCQLRNKLCFRRLFSK